MNFKKLKDAIINNPSLAFHKGKELIRKQILIDKLLLNGYSFLPQNISINMTYLCNLRCKMCGQWGDVGNYKHTDAEFLKQRLNIEELKKLIDDVSDFKPSIYIWGGEPLLHPDILSFIEYIKSKGLICQINTNAILLEKFAKQFVKLGVDGLDVSIDGPNDIHNMIRGGKDTFNKAIKGVQAINHAKQECNQSVPIIKIYSTISEFNYLQLTDIVQIAKNLDTYSIDFLYSWFTTDEIGACNDKKFQDLFDRKSQYWQGFVKDFSDFDIKKLKGTIKELKSLKGFAINFTPNLQESEIEDYYLKPEKLLVKKECHVPWMKADIMPNGDLVTCADFPDFTVGNIKKESFKKLWNNETYRGFRKHLSKQGTFPVCSRCCGLYLY